MRDSLVSDYGVAPDKIEVIPPGVDTARWKVTDHGEDEPMRILFVGGDFERKGGVLLLAAFATLPAGSAVLDVVTRSEVAPAAGVTVHRDLTPNHPELARLFRASHVFALPSQAETFGIAAVEAGAAGLALVVTDVGGLGDLVVDGATGYALPGGDPDALAVALRRLLDAPTLRREMGRAARSHVEREFDATRNGARLVGLARRSVVSRG